MKEVTQSRSRKRMKEDEVLEGDILVRAEARKLVPGRTHKKADFVGLIESKEKFL